MLLEHARLWPMLRRTIGRDWLVGPGIQELTEHPRLGPRITRAGHDMHVWTVNTQTQLELCLELGVKAVITARPAYLLDLLDRPGERRRIVRRHGQEVRAKSRPAPPEGEVGPRQPCPCGSGKRYKACHGAPGGAAGCTSAAR